MKKWEIHRSFIFTMGALGIFLVFIWVLFFLTTRNAIYRSMLEQAEASSGSIITSIESEILSLEDAAYSLGNQKSIREMVFEEDGDRFYDLGAVAGERSLSIIGKNSSADNVVLIRDDGLFYRLKGRMGNTSVNRASYLLSAGKDKIITVSGNDYTYIGVYDRIENDEGRGGYLCLLIEKSRLENLIAAYSDIDYLGIAVYSGEKIIAANRKLSFDELLKERDKAVFARDREVGITGFRLMVFCEKGVSKKLERYFAIAFPLTMIFLFAVVAVIGGRLNKRIVVPIKSIIKNATDNGDKPLPKTGEEYFDDLVNHVNTMLENIETRDRELMDSKIRIKDTELQSERTLLSLLKKQISAHFTVNTLNAVRALINKGEKAKAAAICNELSDLLRYANAGDEYISLMEEFHILEQYVSIMQTRYPERFDFEALSDDSFAEIMIPRMLIQPVVENAILHGLLNKKGLVRISADLKGEDLIIEVYDNGKGMQENDLADLRKRLELTEHLEDMTLKHVALINIQKRIKLVCGEKYGITVESADGKGTKVSILLPKKISEEPEF